MNKVIHQVTLIKCKVPDCKKNTSVNNVVNQRIDILK